MFMEQLKKVVNSSWFKALAIAMIGIVLMAEKHMFYSGIAFGIAVREFLWSLRPEISCEKCVGCYACKK
jgi:hypothetical protein